jgi:hypothetical protein
MHIESREDIIKQDNCGPGVDRSCECHTCLFERLWVVIGPVRKEEQTFWPPLSVNPFSPTSVSSPASNSSRSFSSAH